MLEPKTHPPFRSYPNNSQSIPTAPQDRPPPNGSARRYTLLEEEVVEVAGSPVTSTAKAWPVRSQSLNLTVRAIEEVDGHHWSIASRVPDRFLEMHRISPIEYCEDVLHPVFLEGGGIEPSALRAGNSPST